MPILSLADILTIELFVNSCLRTVSIIRVHITVTVEVGVAVFFCCADFTMRIAVLFEDYSDSCHYLENLGKSRNVAQYDKNHTHTYSHVPLKKVDAVKCVKDLILSKDYDLFINLCEDFDDGNGCGADIVHFLDKMNVAYTGAGPLFYTLSKTAMKIAAAVSGTSIPDYLTVESLDELDENRLAELGMPLIVKHTTGHDSIGLTPESRVTNLKQLTEQVQRMVELYGSATIEQYIDGPEYSVLVIENPNDNRRNDPIVLNPVRCRFLNGCTFKFFDLKWKDYESLTYEAEKDPILIEKLKQATKLVFSISNANGYARCDFSELGVSVGTRAMRVDSKTGELYFLEINANPTVFVDGAFSTADHILNMDPLGFDGFIDLIIKCALKRRERSAPKIKIAHCKRKGFNLEATRNIEKGEVVYVDDCMTLVSGKFVREHWTEKLDPLRHRLMREYALLVGPDLYRIWNNDPNKWLPINHSCDPNTWLTYDVLIEARRLIKKGEEVTIDYSAACMAEHEFACTCGSTDCRKIIRPFSDYQLPGFKEKYENHMASYIESLIKK